MNEINWEESLGAIVAGGAAPLTAGEAENNVSK